jgi:hypothetical protein
MLSKINTLINRSVKVQQKSLEWLTIRHSILTSSEVANALDCNAHEKSIELLKRKCSPLDTSDLLSSVSISWGEKYEPIAKKIFEQMTKEKVVDIGLVIHNQYTWLGTSPDGIVMNGRLLEIKCPYHRVIIPRKIPYYYWIQVQMQMEICDFDECYFFQCRFEENPLNITTSPKDNCYYTGTHDNGTQWVLIKSSCEIIKRDREWFKNNITQLVDFWKKVQHYRIHGLGKLMADLGNKQLYYDLDNNSLEVINKSPKLSDNVSPLILDIPIMEPREDNIELTVDDQKLIAKDTTTQSSILTLLSSENHINWDEWVSATSIRNYLMNDPLIDWLNLYCKGSNRKITGNSIIDEKIASHEDELKDSAQFFQYIQLKGVEFEDAVINQLTKKFPNKVVTIANPYQVRQLDKVRDTITAMKEGKEIIYQAVFHNIDDKTYGVVDLLVRSDFINNIFSKTVLTSKASSKGCKFSDKWHYVIVDIKHIALNFKADGEHLLNVGSSNAYKGQLFIYNNGLGKVQEFTPSTAYILGRKWNHKHKGEKYSGNGWFDRAGSVNFTTADKEIVKKANDAIAWIRKLRSEGKTWTISPPSVAELYPNMNNANDSPWHSTKKALADYLGEITNIWQCGVENRTIAAKNGITSWRNPRCNSKLLGHNGPKISPIIDAILNINRGELKILPKFIQTKLPDNKVSIFLDFETVNDLIGDISKDTTQTDNTSYVYMIGIGWTVRDNPKWNYRCLTTNIIDNDNEKEIFLTMHDILLEIAEENDAHGDMTVYHWSNAERAIYNSTYEKYRELMHDYDNLLVWSWFDLCDLFKNEKIVVKGAFDFSIKSIATTMFKHGFIKTCWAEDGFLDGLNAMVKAMECSETAKKNSISMKDLPVVKKIVDYNEMDCKVMMEILKYVTNNMTKEKVNNGIQTYLNAKRRKLS